MGFIRKNKGSLVRLDSTVYVGEKGYLFWDVDTGCVRLSDGVTPGGVDACTGGDGVPLLPPGGLSGQHLAKLTDNDYDTEWVDAGSGGVPIIPDVPVIPGGNDVIDSVTASENQSIKWIYTLKDSVTEDVMSAEILANHEHSTNVYFTRSSIIGSRIPHSVDVVLDIPSDTLSLVISNLSANVYIVSVARIKISN